MQRNSIDIQCPQCGELARFEEPFEFQTDKPLVTAEMRPYHQWGGWFVIERFPAQFPWKAPSSSQKYLRGGGGSRYGGYPLLTDGLVQCPTCHSNHKHRLDWPKEAYWQWHIRGQVLWAWDKEQAQAMLAYIKAFVRPAKRPYSLRHIPTHFLSAKVRDLVVRKMGNSLNI